MASDTDIREIALRQAVFLLLLLAATPGQALSAAQVPVIYDGATVIDGTGAPPKPDMAIIEWDGRIKAIVRSNQWRRVLGPRATANVIDMHGRYAVPGLIDSHVHLATDPDPPYERALLRRDIFSGVTTVRDMAGDTRVLADLARATMLHKLDGPDIYYAALMAGPQFFHDPRTIASAQGAIPGAVAWMQAITNDTDIRLAVARARGTGATALKIYADLPALLVAKIAAEAHRQNMLVWAHAAVFPASPREVAAAGVDVVSHACLLAYQASATIPPQYHNRASVEEDRFKDGTAVLGPLFAELKARGTILDATVYVYDVMWKVPGATPKPYCTLALAEKIAEAAHRAGVEISTGTDADTAWDKPFPSLFDEIELLVNSCAFTPLEAIRAATLVGARTVGQEKEIGTLQAGKRADIVFLVKNPLDDIANLRSVELTVKGMEDFWRAKYQPITRDEAKGEL
jgi:imidazolonepropionase-like amidohydrolase